MRTLGLVFLLAFIHLHAADSLRIAVFKADATPEIGCRWRM